MVLPTIVTLCDAVELAAICLNKPLFEKDIAKQFFPGQGASDVEAEIKDALALARDRQAAIGSGYPFSITQRSITYNTLNNFNVYVFLLIGRSLEFGGPTNSVKLLQGFRRYFEDIVCWSLRRAGFAAEVLSEPRLFRGLDRELAPALRQISDRFMEKAILTEDRLTAGDNDLDVDVLAVPIVGNASRCGWPIVQIQCATGKIRNLEAKLGEGAKTFTTVWSHGFYPGSSIRAVATPDDLLRLSDVHWLRLGYSGWVIDRTRIAYLGAKDRRVDMLNEVSDFWGELWDARTDIDWQTGWQASN